MAFAAVKQGQMPHDAPGVGDSARDENKDYYISYGQEIELHVVTTTGGTTLGTIDTGFEMVKGGFLIKTSDGVASNVIDVKPNADPTKADVSLIPADAVYLAVIFGFKNPNAL